LICNEESLPTLSQTPYLVLGKEKEKGEKKGGLERDGKSKGAEGTPTFWSKVTPMPILVNIDRSPEVDE